MKARPPISRGRDSWGWTWHRACGSSPGNIQYTELMNIWPHTSQICRRSRKAVWLHACVLALLQRSTRPYQSWASLSGLKAVYPHYIKEKCLPPIDPIPSQPCRYHRHTCSSNVKLQSHRKHRTALKTMTYIYTQSILNISLIQHCMFHPADNIQHSINCMNKMNANFQSNTALFSSL